MAPDDNNTDGKQDENGPDWLKAGTTNSSDVAAYYDDWAVTYNEVLENWEYRAPTEAADVLVGHLQPGAEILDVGCGTGLFGHALSERLDCQIEGLDISAASLEKAETLGCYDRLSVQDLQDVPLPIADNTFDAAGCIGVLTYIEDPAALLGDLCRAVRPGGYIIFTQRDDRWVEKNCAALVADLESRGLWEVLMISEPKPYLPKNDAFGDKTLVIHVLCRVAG
jgi:predicted TPR repeat methyltransferase